MQAQGEQNYLSDSEFYEYIRYNQVENFKSRINAAYLSSLRFTNVIVVDLVWMVVPAAHHFL